MTAEVVTNRRLPRPSMAQRRLILAVANLVDATGGPVVLGDAITDAGGPYVQQKTVDVCRMYGWIVRGDGPAGSPAWDVSDAGRAEVAE